MVKCRMHRTLQLVALKFLISHSELGMQILYIYFTSICLSTKYHMLLFGAINITADLKKNRTSPWDFLMNAIAEFCHRIKKSQTMD